MSDDRFPEALTFDDVLLTPGYSDVLPAQVGLRARLAGRREVPGVAPEDPGLERLATRLDTLLGGRAGTRKCQGP